MIQWHILVNVTPGYGGTRIVIVMKITHWKYYRVYSLTAAPSDITVSLGKHISAGTCRDRRGAQGTTTCSVAAALKANDVCFHSILKCIPPIIIAFSAMHCVMSRQKYGVRRLSYSVCVLIRVALPFGPMKKKKCVHTQTSVSSKRLTHWQVTPLDKSHVCRNAIRECLRVWLRFAAAEMSDTRRRRWKWNIVSSFGIYWNIQIGCKFTSKKEQ
jgi:hypothetical protein